MKRFTYLFAAAGVIAFGLASSWAFTRLLRADSPQLPPIAGHAAWVFKTDDLGAMVRYADAVLVGTLQGRHPGRTAYSSTGEVALDFELNDFLVTEPPIKSDAYVGGIATVERLRGRSFDGGDFQIGARYLLFLKKQPDTSIYIVVNDEARFLVGPRSRLDSAAPGEVAATLRGKSLNDARSLIRASLERQ